MGGKLPAGSLLCSVRALSLLLPSGRLLNSLVQRLLTEPSRTKSRLTTRLPESTIIFWRPRTGVQLASTIDHSWGCFQRRGRIKAIESSRLMERAMGIEPTSEAWEASILPLYDA